MERSGDPEHEVPGSYVVRLRTGHSLKRHYSAVAGFNIEKHRYGSLEPSLFQGRMIYFVKNVDSKMLAAIRGDIGVISVSPDYKWVPQPGLDPTIKNKGELPKVVGKTVTMDGARSYDEVIDSASHGVPIPKWDPA